ncbi:MAG: Ig-like domain-containing protein [Actinomycetia bacterium]|nr:Ig-like domain-containing protein [Actinomycetes bacterium]
MVLLVSCATVAMLAAPGLAAPGALAADPEPVNQAPNALDDVATVTSGQSVVVPVLANDSDPDATPSPSLTLVGVVAAPASGTATVVSGAIDYQSSAGFIGDDAFTYEVSDGDLTAVASVTISVTAVPNTAPQARRDQARTRWGSPVIADVLANDIDADADALALVKVKRPKHGRADVVRGRIHYTPVGKFVGVDTVTYTMSDGRGGVSEGTLAVRVSPRFKVTLRRVSAPVALRTMRVHGVVTTRLDGQVTVNLQRRNDNGRWFDLQQRRIRGDDRFTLTWRAPQPGGAALRLLASWDKGPRDASRVTRLKVEARFDPQVTSVTARDLPHTWRSGCPVPPSNLRQIQMNFWDYQGRLQQGRLIGAASVTPDYIAIFRRAFESGFQIKRMYPADRYGGVDERAMRAGNTSAFNCRHVTGNPYRMSQHSYGNAIDINTFENPYVTSSRVYPPKAAVPYYYRRESNLRDPGVITSGSSIAQELWRQGWSWGARWSPPDYQHWSSNGG